MKKILPPVLSVALVAAFPVLFLYFNNASEIAPAELWAPLGLFVLAGLVLLGISLLFTRSLPKAAVVTNLFLVVLLNYTLIQTGVQRLLPQLGYQHILPVLLFIAGHLAWRIHKKLKVETTAAVSLILCIAFGALTLVNGVMAVPGIVGTVQAAGAKKAAALPTADAGGEKPNFYYFVFDEYSNFDIIEKYYGYDNSAFAEFLESSGFSVSYDSVNESQQTPTILANLFSLDYVVQDDDPSTAKEQARKNSVLQQTLEAGGYTVRGLGLACDYMNIPSVSGEAAGGANKATTMGGADFMTLLLQNTAAGPLLPESDGNAERRMVHDTAAFFAGPECYAQPHGTATITYMKFPHQPFVFTADGGENNLLNWHNWADPQQYLGQYIYATTVMRQMMEDILANDPGAVIVLQSDHSARSLQDASGHYLIEKFDRRHCLNAVYYAGENMDAIQGKSGVNTLRLVISKLLSQDYPERTVPVSEYEF